MYIDMCVYTNTYICIYIYGQLLAQVLRLHRGRDQEPPTRVMVCLVMVIMLLLLLLSCLLSL